jgi:hypothetical protein
MSTALAAAACVIALPNMAAAQAVPADLTTMPPVPTDYTPKKTSWGDPDLRGTWPIDNIASLPMNRPANFGNRFWLTEEEYAARQQQANASDAAYDREDKAGRIGMGHWVESDASGRRTSLLVSPADGKLPALTPQAEALYRAGRSSWTPNTKYNWVTDFDSWDRCITRGLPVSMLPRNYNNGIQITQSPGYVVISLEMVHESRVIPTDGRAPLDPAVKQWLGESRGHWEGNTLVIETANFNGETSMTNPGVPGSPTPPTPTTENLRIVERITRIDDDTMDYSITVEDPEVMTRPWTVSYPMERDDTYQMYEYACHEGNTAVRNYIETSRFERAKAGRGR